MEIFVERAADVRAVLADGRFVPVAPGPGGPVGSMAWLRAMVARFSYGPEHARRRALVQAELAAIEPERLRAAAARSGRPGGEVAVAVLAEAMGVTGVDAVVAALPAVAAVYLTPGDAAAERAADEAVATLVPLVAARPGSEAVAANRIGLLVQAYAATAGLVRAAVRHGSVEVGLREEPPVRTTRRVATVDTTRGAAGDTLVLDLAAAGLPFGGEPRVCPGRAHALAIAAGVLAGAATAGASSTEAEQGVSRAGAEHGASSTEAEQRVAR
jgi:cytochrome P450